MARTGISTVWDLYAEEDCLRVSEPSESIGRRRLAKQRARVKPRKAVSREVSSISYVLTGREGEQVAGAQDQRYQEDARVSDI